MKTLKKISKKTSTSARPMDLVKALQGRARRCVENGKGGYPDDIAFVNGPAIVIASAEAGKPELQVIPIGMAMRKFLEAKRIVKVWNAKEGIREDNGAVNGLGNTALDDALYEVRL